MNVEEKIFISSPGVEAICAAAAREFMQLFKQYLESVREHSNEENFGHNFQFFCSTLVMNILNAMRQQGEFDSLDEFINYSISAFIKDVLLNFYVHSSRNEGRFKRGGMDVEAIKEIAEEFSKKFCKGDEE